MKDMKLAKGVALGIGGTNARSALCLEGNISDFQSQPTPRTKDKFFVWIAEQIVQSAQKGARWAVIGIPGPAIEREGHYIIGPLHNLPGMAEKSYALEEELVNAHPDMKHVLDSGFAIIAVNDGILAAYAAAQIYGEDDGRERHYTIASFIIGTGVGGAVVRRIKDSRVFRPSKSLFEIGHIPLPHDATATFEQMISGPALERRYGMNPRDFPADHEAWKEVGHYVGQLIMMASLIAGADLVVACGGVGSNYYPHYQPHLDAYLKQYKKSNNAVQRLAVPTMVAVPQERAQTFEMHGAEGLMKYYFASSSLML